MSAIEACVIALGVSVSVVGASTAYACISLIAARSKIRDLRARVDRLERGQQPGKPSIDRLGDHIHDRSIT